MTGIGCLYYDSIPSIFIAGQVATFRLVRNATGVRQLGFQEAPHVRLVEPLTKYATLVDDRTRIRYELERPFTWRTRAALACETRGSFSSSQFKELVGLHFRADPDDCDGASFF